MVSLNFGALIWMSKLRSSLLKFNGFGQLLQVHEARSERTFRQKVHVENLGFGFLTFDCLQPT